MTTEMPPAVQYGKVVGRFILAVADEADEGRLPDAIPALGTITFTSLVPSFAVLEPTPTTVVRTTIRCSIGADGQLVDPELSDGVWLVAGDYRVAYNLSQATISSHTIRVGPEHTNESPLDLTNALPPSGPAPSQSQYAQLVEMINNLPSPEVDSVNGKTGAVVLYASDLDAWTKLESDSRYMPVGAEVGVSSVNSQTGVVVLSASDLDAYTKSEVDALFDALPPIPEMPDFKPRWRGVWDASRVSGGDAETFEVNDLIWYDQTFYRCALTGTTSTPGTNSDWVELTTGADAPVTSVNGQTGEVTISFPVTSVNGKTGEVIITAPVSSVNGQTGVVSLTASDVGAMTQAAADARYLRPESAQSVLTKTASYTVTASDVGKLILMDSTSAVSIRVPTDASENIPNGSRVDVLAANTGAVSASAVTPGTTSLNGTPSLTARARYSAFSLIKVASNTWVAVGDLA